MEGASIYCQKDREGQKSLALLGFIVETDQVSRFLIAVFTIRNGISNTKITLKWSCKNPDFNLLIEYHKGDIPIGGDVCKWYCPARHSQGRFQKSCCCFLFKLFLKGLSFVRVASNTYTNHVLETLTLDQKGITYTKILIGITYTICVCPYRNHLHKNSNSKHLYYSYFDIIGITYTNRSYRKHLHSWLKIINKWNRPSVETVKLGRNT